MALHRERCLKMSIKRYATPQNSEIVLFCLLMSGPPRLRARDAAASLSGTVDWAVGLSAIIWGIGALWALKHVSDYLLINKSFPQFPKSVRRSLVFATCLSFSIFVSLAPALSLFRVFQVFISILFIYFWTKKYGFEQTLKYLFIGISFHAFCIAVSAIFMPNMVFLGDRLIGKLLGNTGEITVIGLILALSLPSNISKKWKYYLLLSLFVILMILSETRTAYVSFVFFLLLSAMKNTRYSYSRRLIGVLLIVFPLIIIFDATTSVTSWVIRSPQSVPTLSGRLPLWEYIILFTIDESPWFGLGFYANRTVTMQQNVGLGTSHSSYIEIFSGGGIISSVAFLLLLLPLIFYLTRMFLKYGKNNKVLAITGLFSAALLMGLSSESMIIASPVSFTFWTVVVLSFYLPKELDKHTISNVRQFSY